MSLWMRDGDKLCLKDKPEDFLVIIGSDRLYPETIVCEDAKGVKLQARQLSPNLYVVEKVIFSIEPRCARCWKPVDPTKCLRVIKTGDGKTTPTEVVQGPFQEGESAKAYYCNHHCFQPHYESGSIFETIQ